MLLAGAERQSELQSDGSAVEEFDRQIRQVAEAQSRLLRMYTTGTMPEDLLTTENTRLGRESQHFESLRAAASPAEASVDLNRVRAQLPQACERVRTWVERAAGDDFELLLSALQVEVAAAGEEENPAGVIPMQGGSINCYSECSLAPGK